MDAKDIKRNIKYFTTHGISPIAIAALLLTVAGVVVAYIFFGSSEMKYVAFIGLGVALVAFVVFCKVFGGKSSPSDLDFYVLDKTRYLGESAQKRHEVYESQFSKVIDPVLLKGYDYNTEGVYFKKGSDNKNRTNVYNTAILYFTKDRMYIYGKHFSLTDDMFDREIMGKYRFTDLAGAEIVDEEKKFPIGKYVSRVNAHTFIIKKNDGEVVLSMTVDYGADMDKAVDDINRVIAVAKDEAAKKAAAEANA